jgi:hypothetical protein
MQMRRYSRPSQAAGRLFCEAEIATSLRVSQYSHLPGVLLGRLPEFVVVLVKDIEWQDRIALLRSNAAGDFMQARHPKIGIELGLVVLHLIDRSHGRTLAHRALGRERQ